MQVNEEQDIGDMDEDRKTEQGFTPGPWEVRADNVFAPGARANIATASDPYSGRFVGYTKLEINSSHFNEACANARLIAAAPALYEIVHAIGDRCTNMYAGQRCPLGFKDSKMWCLPCRAVAVLALVNKPDTNSANSIHPAHGQASKTEVQK